MPPGDLASKPVSILHTCKKKIPNLKKIKILGPQITGSFAFTKEGFKPEKKVSFCFCSIYFLLVQCFLLMREEARISGVKERSQALADKKTTSTD